MSGQLFKAVGIGLCSFRDAELEWRVGSVVAHPSSEPMVGDRPATYLSVSTQPAETLIGGRWPCRLLEVEAVGDTIGSLRTPFKRAGKRFRVVRELEAWRALGPNGRMVVALLDRVGRLSNEEMTQLDAARGAAWVAALDAAWDTARGAALGAAWVAARDAAWDTARGAAWDAALDAAWVAARDAARDAAWDTARGAAWDAAWDAACALVVADLISDDQFKALAGPWIQVIGDPRETATSSGAAAGARP